MTGATSGLGRAAALALAKNGHHVVAAGRDPVRGASLLAELLAVGSAELAAVDLFSLADTRAWAARLAQAHPRIALLVNNAGGAFSENRRTGDGLERTFALNVAAPFVLQEGLAGALVGGRVLNIVTGVQAGVTTTLAQLDEAPGFQSYIRCKLALLMVTAEAQLRHPETTFVALHPGVIPGTNFGNEHPAWLRSVGPVLARLFRFGSTAEEAAARYVTVGTGPVEPAGFYYEGVLRPMPRQVGDAAFRAALWQRLASHTSAG